MHCSFPSSSPSRSPHCRGLSRNCRCTGSMARITERVEYERRKENWYAGRLKPAKCAAEQLLSYTAQCFPIQPLDYLRRRRILGSGTTEVWDPELGVSEAGVSCKVGGYLTAEIYLSVVGQPAVLIAFHYLRPNNRLLFLSHTRVR